MTPDTIECTAKESSPTLIHDKSSKPLDITPAEFEDSSHRPYHSFCLAETHLKQCKPLKGGHKSDHSLDLTTNQGGI